MTNTTDYNYMEAMTEDIREYIKHTNGTNYVDR